MSNKITFSTTEILKKVTILFHSKGYCATSMQDIVTVSNLNRSSIYNTFGSKLALFINCFESCENNYRREIQKILDKIEMKCDLNFKNLFNIEEDNFSMQGNFSNLTSNYKDLKALLPNVLGESIPSVFDKLGNFTINGDSKITSSTIAADLEIVTELGYVISNLEMKKIDDIDNATYTGNVIFDDATGDFVGVEDGTVLKEELREINFSIGMEYLYVDDFTNARLNFANCIDVDFEDYSSLYNVVYCFDMENNHEEAITYLTNYIETNPYCEVAWHQLGRQFFVLNRFKEALRAFDYAVLIDESFIGGYLEKAKTLEELERYEEAIQNYLITLELDDPTAFVYIRTGECYQKLGDLNTAVKYFKKAVHEDPLLDKAWLLLTELYLEEKEYQKAQYYISKALHIDDSNAMYWRKYAEINLKLSFYEEAVKAFQKCLELDDHSLEIYVGLADVLFFIGDFEDALKIIVKAKNTYRQFAEIEYRLCGLFLLTSDEKNGLIHLKNALAIDADYRSVMQELYPTVFENEKVQTIINNYLKATE